jgi:hypothetical protein
MADESEKKEQDGEDEGSGFELLTGLVLAIFAAFLSINGLGAGKFGDDEQNAIISTGSQFSWLQSKSVKKSLTENQVSTLQMLLDSGLIAPEKSEETQKQIAKNKSKVERYEHEIKIIQEGPGKYEKEEWFAKLDDEKIKHTVGAEELEKIAEGLGSAGDNFDYGELFLQLCLVFGAISLVIKKERLKKVFFGAMLVGGVLGAFFTIIALRIAWAFL